MPFIDELRNEVKNEHKVLGRKPFLTSYRAQLTLETHYLHLKALLPIYLALEVKMTDSDFATMLPVDRQYLLERSAKIKQDLAFLTPRVSPGIRQWHSHSAEQYAREVQACNSPVAIVGHFLARILGDLYGGQRIKQAVQGLYQSRNIQPVGDVSGVGFYTFKNRELRLFKRWLNKTYAPGLNSHEKNELINAVKRGIVAHSPIFDELENKRQQVHSRSSGYRGFFTPRNAAVGVAVAAAVATTGYVAYRYYQR